MPDFPPKKTLEELKSEAIAKLESRGYDVRGKTPACKQGARLSVRAEFRDAF
jgi:hypothetical protein